MIIPPKLKKGDTIGIVSPSTPLEPEQKKEYDRGIKVLEELGFKTKLGKHVFADLNSWRISSGTPEEKARDINEMFLDTDVKAITTSIGGKTSVGVLDLLDFKSIKENPKIFCGFSDSTTLVNAITSMTDLVTFYGCSIHHNFGKYSSDYFNQEFIKRFVEGYTGEVNKNSNWEEIRPGAANGRLVGGSLRSLSALIGTKYFPNLNNTLLFTETYGNDLGWIMTMFYHLKNLGVWDMINGVVMGYNCNNEENDSRVSVEELLLEVSKDYDFPILKVRDFGHRTEATPIPLWVTAEINTADLSFKILDEYVE